MRFIKNLVLIISISIIYLVFLSFTSRSKSTPSLQEEIALWENQLNELNFLVFKISATNLINGLCLTPKQIEKLLELQKEIDALNIAPIKSENDLVPEITSIRSTYKNLLHHIIYKRKLSDEFKKQVFTDRVAHSLLIKKTLHGKRKTKKSKMECIQCHVLPRNFPKSDIRDIKNKKIHSKLREKIDKAHAIGIFGHEGNLKIWSLKEKVDTILTNSQRNIVNSFSSCLLPPTEFDNPLKAGQAFSSEDWIKYFREVRYYDSKSWRKYKNLYMIPVEDLIIATLPSITDKKKQFTLKKIEYILDDIKKMDDATFELKKYDKCKEVTECYDFSNIAKITNRSKVIEQYVACMFLLFPGNSEVYKELLKN